jgi:hypothetical protein
MPYRYLSWLRRFISISFFVILPLWLSTTTQAYGAVTAWGKNNQGQTAVPAGLSGVVAIAGGGEHTVALKSDGTVVAWGNNAFGQSTVPAGLSGVAAIAAGQFHTVALKNNGTVVAWGDNSYGQTTVPSLSGVVAIAAGANHTVALKNDGTVGAWGWNSAGQTTVPAGLSGVVAIAAGGEYTVALKSDGTVVGWGQNNAGQAIGPAGLSGVVAIAAGGEHTVALKSDGTVVAWGNNAFGQTTVPAGLSGVTAIAGGGEYTVALKSNGTVVAWGDNTSGQTTVPAGLNGIVAITAGGNHTVALSFPTTAATTTTTLTASPSSSSAGQAVTLTATVGGSTPTGTVTFKDGNATLGFGTIASGKATLSYIFNTAGTHSLTAKYTGNASNVPSTSAGITLTVNMVNVDLIMTMVNTAAGNVTPGQNFTINYTEKNQGTANMTASSNAIQFYLSSDSTITSADALIGSETVQSSLLTAGSSFTSSITVTVPATLALGTYYIGAIADAGLQQPETNESNNWLAGGTITAINPSSLNNSNLMGINIGPPFDYAGDRLYADVMKVSRDFNISGTTTPAPVDANGWPLSDFSFYVWQGIDKMNGTYTMTFSGQAANVKAVPGGDIPVTYDAATNTSTGTLNYTYTDPNFLVLYVTGTQRTSSSALGSGVTSMKLMRPLTPGATQSYPSSALFNAPLKALVSKFSTIRFLDFVYTNSNAQKDWSDRPLPTWASVNRSLGGHSIGGPWEHVILLSNETGKDAWINIPFGATDAYIKNVALMFAYGSDGANPYTSPQANPIYPPLNANLNLYVEYSNELWNFGAAFTQSANNKQAAMDELVSTSGNSPLNWDNGWHTTADDYTMSWRRVAKRSVEISNLFRSVFGDNAMGTRIRPVLMSQLGNAGALLFDETKMMLDYYNNLGGNFVANPHPPSYYFYGAGGSGYYRPTTPPSSLDALFADSGMNPAGFTPALQDDAKRVAAMGLKRVAYEGGPSLDMTNTTTDNLYKQAVNDSRMTTTLVNMHNTWSSNGGELLVYFAGLGDYQWGFTSDVYNLVTPKFQAIDSLNSTRTAPLTFGMQIPGTLGGSAADTCSKLVWCNANSFIAGTDPNLIHWASYSFRSSSATPWTITLSFASASSDAMVAMYVDGVLIGTQSPTGGALSFNAGSIGTGLHGVIVRAVAGVFSLNSVGVAQN